MPVRNTQIYRPSPSCAPYKFLAITQSTYTSKCTGKDSLVHPPWLSNSRTAPQPTPPLRWLKPSGNIVHSILKGRELSSFPTLNNRTFDSPLESVDFTIPDIKKHLRTCNLYSSMGPDNVHLQILKEAADFLAPALNTVSLENALNTGRSQVSGGRLPSLQIYKKGSRHSPSSYRPISLTSISCKIYERVD